MTLEEILDRCQFDHEEAWRVVPGHVHRLWFAGLREADDPDAPGVEVVQCLYRAVYEPAPELAIEWGIDADNEAPDELRGKPRRAADWAKGGLGGIKSARSRYAIVLFQGGVVWEVNYASVDSGSGISGCLPWPQPKFDGDQMHPSIVAWEASEWEERFAQLLTALQDADEFFRVMNAERGGITVLPGHPLWPS